MRARKLKIGLDLHNLSTREDAVVRTGIQQVVWNLLEAQYHLRRSGGPAGVDLVPLPRLPLGSPGFVTTLSYPDWRPTHVNNSDLVLDAAAQELGVDGAELWGLPRPPSAAATNDAWFYAACADLDWLVITGLCEFRHVIDGIRHWNPRLRVAVLLYDLIPIMRPEVSADGMRRWFERCYLASIRQFADLVFTISRHSAVDCAAVLKTSGPTRAPIVATILPGEVPELADADAGLAATGLPIEAARYFICLGTLEPRKNVLAAISAFARFRELLGDRFPRFKLVIVGKEGWSNEDESLLASSERLKEDIVFAGYAARETVEGLIRHAAALLMPARYEGFGLPVTLAGELGTPAIACANSSLPEAGGADTIYVDASRTDELVCAMAEAASRRPAPRSGAAIAERRQRQKDAWVELLRSWTDTLKDFSTNAASSPSPGPSRPTGAAVRPRRGRRLKVVFETHNLSISPHQLMKSGIQEVTHNIVKALGQLRQEAGQELELIALATWPETVPTGYSVTCQCGPRVFKAIEREAGRTSEELWGFDFAGLGYRLDETTFARVVRDADLFFVTSQLDLRRIVPQVKRAAPTAVVGTVLYDIIPTLFPQLVVPRLDQWFTYDFLRSVRRFSDTVHCISRHSAIDYLAVTEGEPVANEVFVNTLPICVYHDPAPGGRKAKRSPLPAALRRGRYFVLLGNNDPRKNCAAIIRGFLEALATGDASLQDATLVLVGPSAWRSQAVSKLDYPDDLKRRVYDAGYLSDADLAGVLAGASGMVMVSYYEGFGIPLALGSALGLPLLTAANSSLPEVAGLDAIYVSPSSVDDIAVGFRLLAARPRQAGAADSWVAWVRRLIACAAGAPATRGDLPRMKHAVGR